VCELRRDGEGLLDKSQGGAEALRQPLSLRSQEDGQGAGLFLKSCALGLQRVDSCAQRFFRLFSKGSHGFARLIEDGVGLPTSFFYDPLRFLPSLADCEIGGALSEYEGAANAPVVKDGNIIVGTTRRTSRRCLGKLCVKIIDRNSSLLEKLVDFVGVVTAKAVPKLDFTQHLPGDFHAGIVLLQSRKTVDTRIEVAIAIARC